MIILEQAAETLAAFDFAVGRPDGLVWLNQPVLQALMIPFGMVVVNVLVDGMPKHLCTEEDHPVETFFFNRSDKAFRKGIQVGTSRRQANRLDAGGFEDLPEVRGEFRVAIHEQMSRPIASLSCCWFSVSGDQ